jgi:cell wall-associated NlpC family hydrolase
MNKYIEKFLEEIKNQVGRRYALGGGQMPEWKHKDKKTGKIFRYRNFDKNGLPVGFDCSGGIMWALKKTFDMPFQGRTPHGMYKAWWVYEIPEEKLLPGDLIFVDLPKGVMPDGKIDYGKMNHVMTYIGNDSIITTEGAGGDFRVNPKSGCKTIKWTLSAFKKVSSSVSGGLTKYAFRRINWVILDNYKKRKKF